MVYFALAFLVLTVFAGLDDCKFVVGKTTYDLSSLAGRTIIGQDTKVTNYQYHLSTCGNAADPCEDIMTGQTLRGAVYQFGSGTPGAQGVCWDVLAFWDEDGYPTASALDRSSGAAPGTDGITLKYANGDECRNEPRRVTANYICSTAVGDLTGAQDEMDSCHFILNLPTPAACSGRHTPPPTPNPTPSPDHRWSINGTFDGVFQCVTTECEWNPTEVELKGTCSDMKLIALAPAVEVFDIEFDVCGGYHLLGEGVSIGGVMRYRLEMGYLAALNKYMLYAWEQDFPYNVVFTIEFTKLADLELHEQANKEKNALTRIISQKNFENRDKLIDALKHKL